VATSAPGGHSSSLTIAIGVSGFILSTSSSVSGISIETLDWTAAKQDGEELNEARRKAYLNVAIG
jgi:hypothetical protein